MEDLTLKERFVRSVKGKEVDKVPVCSVTQTGTVELMEACGAFWPEANYDAEKMATLAIAGHEVAGLEAVRLPFSTTVIAETLGCTIAEGSVDVQPYELDFPCKTTDDAKKLEIPGNLLESEGIRTVIEATGIIKEKVGDDVPIIAGMIGPAATAFYVAGANNYLRWCITEPEVFQELLAIGEAVCGEYANALYENGADAVIIIDSEAGPDLLPPPLFESIVLPMYRSLTSKMKGLKLLHICGDATDILEGLAVSGFQALSLEEKVDARYAKEIIGKRACLIGNISPAATLLAKSHENIKKEAKQCIEDGVDILAPGCGIAPRTPTSNIQALVDARDEYYIEKGLL
ncbi:MtaA/CmuA family methyltransferase [Methanolobus zinderi]|uniref:MtaA/CmuA family methyltransferase n=1 Tax=Methanolobus zinderi TaxID=536044 RepID=A0A7D5E6G3_9EURY|nr:methylcobamide:CoM methyltransferase MtaA [Methanolobus zinderi]KXS40380.1 MAG: methylcobalamin:coenzyme M methyltransferase [Methanolobus sp. T82-4]QLC49873.1 MtaA/CmuA family methyltransferase [Methanolobus zinderi]